MRDIDNVRIPIDSEEFANAWRIVSEALLQFIQRTYASVGSTDKPSINEKPPVEEPNTKPTPLPPEVPERKSTGDYYAVAPTYKNEGYIFKGRGLKEDQDSYHLYHITCFNDNTFEFEVIPTLEEEGRENFKNSTKKEEGFIIVNGQITPDCPIKIIRKGKGKIIRKRESSEYVYRITEPVEVDLTGAE